MTGSPGSPGPDGKMGAAVSILFHYAAAVINNMYAPFHPKFYLHYPQFNSVKITHASLTIIIAIFLLKYPILSHYKYDG